MSSRSGGLLELVARGKKDVFFTSNPVISYVHSVYRPAAAFSKEIYVSKPRNLPDWGHTVDFDLDHRGDLARQFYLRIDLPTWLPPVAAAANPTGIVTDGSGVTFGYCANIGSQMISKIQLFEDQVILQESYGEYLDWRVRQTNDLVHKQLIGAEGGAYPDTSLGIGRSSTRRTLRVPIPMLGWEGLGEPGFPSIALRQQRYRLRIHIRPLHEVVVASDGRIRPQPWGGKPLRIQSTKGGPVDTSQVTLPLSAMKAIGMSLESTQIYVPADVALFLKSQTLRFPFRTIQFQQFTLDDNLMTAASPPFSISTTIPLSVDFIGSVTQLVLGVRSEASTLAGQRNVYRPAPGSSTGAFVASLRLNISNIDRVRLTTLPLLREVTSYWKHTAMLLDPVNPVAPAIVPPPAEVYTMSFGGFDAPQPAGTLNLTRASLPVLYLTAAPTAYDRRIVSRKAYALLYAESWNIFEIAGGRGRMMFDDS